MFEPRKKIRQLNEALDDSSKAPEMEKIVDAIKANQPTSADSSFEKSLKAKLLEKHKSMTMKNPLQSEEKASFWSGFRFPKWAYALGIVLVIAVAALASYPFIPAPTVQGYILKNSVREVSVNAPFKVTFSQLMDRSSVEKAFKTDPALTGKFEWNGNTLNFVPDQPRKIGETYQVSVGTGAMSLIKKPLAVPYEEFFRIVKTPEVTLFTPNDKSTEIPADTKINMMFDRPMVEFTTLENGENLFPDVKIEPDTKGRFKWLGTSTLQFIPEKLAQSTTYKITIPAGVKSLDGGSTEKDFITTFDTVRPVVNGIQSTDALNDQYFSTESKIKVNFNQKVELNGDNGVQQMIVLQKVNGNQSEVVPFDARYYTELDFKNEQKRAGELFEMSQADEIKTENSANVSAEPQADQPALDVLEQSIILSPKPPLQPGTQYTLVVKSGLRGFEGPLGTLKEMPFPIKTVDQFTFTTAAPADQSDRVQNINFQFSTTVDLRSFKGKVHITPVAKDSEGKNIDPVLTSIDNIVMVGYNYLPSTKYNISIDTGVKDIFGKTLEKPISYDFTTPALNPDFSLESGTDITVVDGNKPSLFYVKSVNIKNVDVKLKKLTQDEFNGFYGAGYVNSDSVRNYPDDQFTQTASLPITLKQNQIGHTKLNLDQLFNQKLEPGYYFLRISNPQVKQNLQISKANQIIVVSKSSLALKLSTRQLLAWATDTTEGKPIADMKITVKTENGSQSLEGTTDKNGLATISLPDPGENEYYRGFTVIGTKDNDLAFAHTSWSEGVAPWNFNINSEYVTPNYYAYVYTDRPIYRPNQEVFFKGIIRQDTDKGFKLPDITKVTISVSDPQGNNIYKKELPVNQNGTFNTSLQLGQNIATGDYFSQVTLIGAKGPAWANQFNANFRVYEYRKPEYKMDITSDKTDYINGETAKITVNAGYFFGAPLPNTDIKWTAKSSDYYFILPESLVSKLNGSWFSFAEDGFFCYWGCQSGSEIVSQGTGKTDAQGNFQFTLPLQIGDKKMSQIYTIEATASDANNQSVSNRATITVHKGETYVGIRSTDYIVEQNKPAKFEVLTVSPQGEMAKGSDVEVSLFKREWNTIKRKNVDSDFYYENNYTDTLIEKKSVKTGDNGLGQIEFTIKDGGSFKVEAALKDSRGNTVKSSTTIYAGSGNFINWGSENNDKIELVTDKTEYKIGDTAKVMIKSPYRGVYALVTAEKDRVFYQKVIKLESNSQTVDIPVTDKFLPNAYVSVVLVKGNKYDAGLPEPPAGNNDERQVAAFKVGYATLQVSTADKKLSIDIKSDKAVYGPKEKVKLTLKTLDNAGKPVAAELSVGVVDESVLSLTESVTADLINVFYRQRQLGVTFAHTLTKAISRVNVVVEAGEKGGGGGDLSKRGTFKDTAYFAAIVNTDENGNATVEFDLPDNLTTWQVMAIGITKDQAGKERTLVGSNKFNFLVNKDVLVRPVLPRFFTSGDEMVVSAIVHNYTDSAQNTAITLNATGIEILDGANRSANIASKSSEKLSWKVRIGDGYSSKNSAKLDFKATSQDKSDEIEQTLPIHQASFATNVATSKVITGDAKEIDQVWLPLGLDTNKGKLTVSISPTLAGTINKGVEYLMAFPYGCTEQLASAILPNLALKELVDLKKFDTKAIDQNQLKKNVEAGLQAIYKNQKPNGGFGIWLESDPAEWVTAYVLNTFYLAEKNGFTIDKNINNRAVEFLRNSIKNKSIKGESPEQTANSRAYVLYVLSEIEQGDLGLTNNLYDSLNMLGLSSKAYLAMAYQNLVNQNKVGADKTAVLAKIDSLKKDLENAAKQTPRGVTFEDNKPNYFESNTSVTALVFKALNRIDSENPLIPKVLQALLREKQAGHYASTRETAISLLAMIEYLKASKELSPAYEGTITLNGQEKLKKSFTSANLFDKAEVEISLKDLLPDNLDNEIASQKVGQGKMYVDMNLEYYLPLNQLKARNEGIEITQEYFSLDDKKMEHPLTEAKVAQNLKAKMTVIVPEDRDYVIIEDYLPAGLEGIDFNLKTSEQNLNDGEGMGECFEGDCYRNWYFIHSEVRDDRIMYWADYLPKGVYEIEYFVRPTSVGTFADLPAEARENYFPEVFGRTAGKTFKVTE